MKALCRIISGILSAHCLFASALGDGAVTEAEQLPSPVRMSKGAGAGMLLLLEITVKGGGKALCALDTGSPNTVLPTSFEPRLGKRLGSRRFVTLESRNEIEHLYAAPEIYLGSTRLVTGEQVGTWGTFEGILGMDCLRHYCIQLDFEAREVRFMDRNRSKVGQWGKPFVLRTSRYATIKHPGFFQAKDSELLIDTGCPFDGYLSPRLFKQAVRAQPAKSLPLLKDGAIQGTAPGMALFPNCIWDDQTYTNLIIGRGPNLVGLRFLGRHLVTFDFPGQTIYLKLRRAEP